MKIPGIDYGSVRDSATKLAGSLGQLGTYGLNSGLIIANGDNSSSELDIYLVYKNGELITDNTEW